MAGRDATIAETFEGARTQGRPLGLRVIPELRQALKVEAARKGERMEILLHRMLCRGLGRRDLLDRDPAAPSP